MARRAESPVLELIPIRGVWTLPTPEELRAYRMAQAARAFERMSQATQRTTRATEAAAEALNGFAAKAGRTWFRDAVREAEGQLQEELRRKIFQGPITFGFDLGEPPSGKRRR